MVLRGFGGQLLRGPTIVRVKRKSPIEAKSEEGIFDIQSFRDPP